MSTSIDLSKAYNNRTVLVTGGASFIGSHLVEVLLGFGADVTVVDDFSSGRRSNLTALSSDKIIELDLADRTKTFEELPASEYVFHLAAVHGGRGFIETYPDQVLVNMAIDNNVYSAAAKTGARRVVHASSACVYPTTLQAESTSQPAQVKLSTLAALCTALDCTPNDLFEVDATPVPRVAAPQPPSAQPAAVSGHGRSMPPM